MSTSVRHYDPTVDRDVVFQLWETVFADTWPLYPDGFYATVDPQAEHHLVAASGGRILGYITGSRDSQENGSIFAIVVHPDHWGEGIESRLLAAATQHLRALGVTKLRFGCGHSYFWPGVPADQSDILELLERNQWQEGEQITDMVGDVERFCVPEDIAGRIARSGAHLRLAIPEDDAAILQFEAQHFPEWQRTAAGKIEKREFANILLAELEGEIVGTNFLTAIGDPEFLWPRVLGADCAAFGCLGVSEAVRGRYIGYALATRAAEILKERQAKRIFLGWVFSTEWYERIGFQAWKTYQSMSKDLSER